MPRLKRIVVPGLPHHITQRGNSRANVFFDDEDREVFLRILGEVSECHGLTNFSYSLMTNHIHLISAPKLESSLARSMRDLLGPYAAYLNRKYGFNGRLWQGRFHSTPLDDAHFWEAIRYVERNPVRAGLVQRAEQYQWSSAAAHCGLRQDYLLAPLPDAAAFIDNWSTWLSYGEGELALENIRRCTKTGRPCGSESFVKDLERTLGKALAPRKGGRSSKKTAAPI
jgi:putative transposase